MKHLEIFNTKDENVLSVIRKMGSQNYNEAMAAQYEFAQAVQEPLRKGMLVGDIVDGLRIFTPQVFSANTVVEYELDLLAPGTEGDYVAYTNPGNGRLPSRTVEADFMTIPVYGVANAIHWLLRFAEDARQDVIGRCLQIFYAGFIKKRNNDCFHTLLAAGLDRNIIGFDADATGGQLTKRLFTIGKILMKRNAGGNSTSLNRGKLTDLIMSPEMESDMLHWNLDQIDDVTRREFYVAREGATKRIWDVNIHSLDEFGEGQEYQNFYLNTLGGSLAASDVELMVGLDLQNRDSFVLPVQKELQVFNDQHLHKEQKAGLYGWQRYGVGVLDTRRVMLFSA